MDTEKMIKCGFVEDKDCLLLKEVLNDNTSLKEVCIDIYSEDPFSSSIYHMLLLRTKEKNISISNEDGRLILKKNDNYETHIINVLSSKIKECFSKICDGYSEFILNIQNVYYKISIFN